MVAAITLEQLAERVSHLEGWKESQERFSQQLLEQLSQVGERLSRVEDELKFLDQKWENRLNGVEERWEKRFAELRDDVNGLRAELKHLDDRWEARFNQQQAFWEERFKDLGTRIWWLVGLQFTILLAILALLVK